MIQYSRPRAYATLILLACIWGTSFLLIKYGLHTFSPMHVGDLRMLIACTSLLPFVLHRAREIPRKSWIPIVFIGLLGSGIPAVLFPLAQTHINSATAGVLNGLTPPFTFIFGVIFFATPITRLKVIGIVLGFSGAAMLAAGGDKEVNILQSFGYSALAMLAAMCYGLSINLQKKYTVSVPPLLIGGYALVFAMLPHLVMLGVDTSWVGEFSRSATGWQDLGAIAILAVMGSGVSFVIFNDLVQKTDAVFASTSTYITPIFAIAWGLLDGETLTLLQYMGMVVILGGVYLINKKMAAPLMPQKA